MHKYNEKIKEINETIFADLIIEGEKMKYPDRPQNHYDLLRYVNMIPRKMLLLHGHENVIDFVLYALCADKGFNLQKAAFFIDNPDFDWLKGIAGFSRQDVYSGEDIWQDPHGFSSHMNSASFHQKVRSIHRPSMRKQGQQLHELVENLAHDVELKDPGFYTWDIKNDNNGIFLYEKNHDDASSDEYILDGLCLLGFCPIY